MNWRQTTFYASVLAGVAVYFSWPAKEPSSEVHHLSKIRFVAPHFVPKHPGRLFTTKTPTHQQVFAALTENQFTINLPANFSSSVSSIDHTSLASNEPCEDRHSESLFDIDGKLVGIFAVFDGHSGNECSETLRQLLPSYVASHLKAALSSSKDRSLAIKQSLEDALVEMDNDMLNVALDPQFNMKKEAASPALAGAVALLTCIIDKELFVANVGDVRAVMGSASPLVAKPLSIDHNADNPQEVERITSEHPKEKKEVLLYRKRVLGGLMPTRAFGDASYKWTREQIEELSLNLLRKGNGELAKRIRPISASKTPPYVTAKPEVHQYDIKPEDKFIILASDGLWDTVSSEEAVHIVGNFDKGVDRLSGENAASYLMRKALEKKPPGYTAGDGKDFCAKLLTIPPPYSRNYRDDITVNVIFLDGRRSETTNYELSPEVPVKKTFESQFVKYASKL